jgi:hypothetical protein
MKIRTLFLVAGMIVFFSACKKDDEALPTPVPPNNLNFSLSYEVDGQAAVADTILYTTDAGYPYSVVSLRYYLSEITLIKSDGTPVAIKAYHYASLTDATTKTFSISAPPQGSYKGISFNIGIDSVHNVADGLPINNANIDMIWPEPMGGGYHFMKFEGYYTDSTGTYGYAMHLGNNANIVTIALDTNFTIGTGDLSMPLIMNLNEWFRNPAIYDFNIDGNYSMSSPAAMAKLTSNGHDVFHF